MEHLIDVRLESLKNELDDFENSLMRDVEFFENKCLNRKDVTIKKSKYFWMKKPLNRLKSEKIGIIYNEFKLDSINCEDEDDYDSENEGPEYFSWSFAE
jgi:hypothetical protein